MIVGLKGNIFHLEIGKVQFEANSIIYELFISFKTFEILKELTKDKTQLTLHVYHSITDRSEKLFGFMSKKERDIFYLIKSLQGIGEMTALRVLSFLTPEELIQCVMNNDRTKLEKIPKVKGKTSEKIVFEIKQNLKKFEEFLSDNTMNEDKNNSDELTLLALIQLGYEEKTAIREIKRIREITGFNSPSDLIKEILKLS